jgi:hypothetical protein
MLLSRLREARRSLVTSSEGEKAVHPEGKKWQSPKELPEVDHSVSRWTAGLDERSKASTL